MSSLLVVQKELVTLGCGAQTSDSGCPFMTRNADSLSKIIGYLIASLRNQLASLTANLSEQFAKGSFCMLFEAEFDYRRVCQDCGQDTWIIGNILSVLCFNFVDLVRVSLL